MRCAPPTPPAEGCCRRWRSTATAPRRGAGAEPRGGAPAGPSWCCAPAARWPRLNPGGSAVGFHVPAPAGRRRLVELTRNESSSPVAAARAERFFSTLGKHVAWVGDAPGLVLGRIVCQVINECRLRPRRRGRQRRGHRPRDGTRPQPPPRPVRVGRPDRPRARAVGAPGPVRRVPRGALPARTGAATAGGRPASWAGAGRAASSPAAHERPGESPDNDFGCASHIRGRPGVIGAMSETPPPFQVFLDENRDAVWRFLVSSVGPWRPRTASRRRSSAALRAYPRLRAGSNIRAWVLTIAHRKAVDSHRGRARRALPVAELEALDTRAGGRSDPGRRRAVGSGQRAAPAAALGGRAALPGRPPPPRDRGRDRLLGGGRATIAPRGTAEAQNGGGRMNNRTEDAVGRALRAAPPRGRAETAAAAPPRAAAGEDRRRAARRHHLRAGWTRPSAPSMPPSPNAGWCGSRFPRSRSRRCSSSSRRRISPRIVRSPRRPGRAAARARGVLRGAPERVLGCRSTGG